MRLLNAPGTWGCCADTAAASNASPAVRSTFIRANYNPPTVRVALTLFATAFGGVLAFAQAPHLNSGLNPANFDASVRPQDDLYKYVNGGWASRATIPPDRVSHGLFTELADKAQLDLRALVEGIANTPNRQAGSPAQQIGDLYASLMDQARLDALGAQPIE